jgi:electron transfer flavoprotein alpha subunit
MADTFLVVAEVRHGKLNSQSLEAIAAGQQLAGAAGKRLVVALPGKNVGGIAGDLAALEMSELVLVEHDLLDPYTPDGFCAALRGVIEDARPEYVLFPHTYQVRDFAPKLAAGFRRGLISDCVGTRSEGGDFIFVRQMFQGKANADVLPVGDGPHFVSFQAGAYRSDAVKRASKPCEPRRVGVTLDASRIRTKPEEAFREAAQSVDLSRADVIVAVGRGIKSAEGIDTARKLAGKLGAEIAASRPVCDEGWLPMDLQIGSSGQTVSPKLYVALGISGAIQHVVGMKGSRVVVAVNKDKSAPIFEVADFGIVGDLFEVVPALVEALEAASD